MRTPSWTQLHALGTNKVVNTSFIWLAVIPFLSRLLESIHAWTQHVPTLPFNFVAFYFAAFFFSIAALIFNWKCPTVAKLAPSYGEFRSQGYSPVELKHWFIESIFLIRKEEEFRYCALLSSKRHILQSRGIQRLNQQEG